MKIFLSLILLGWFVVGCHTAKKAQVAVAADTVVAQSPAVTLKAVDSTAIIKQQLLDIIHTPLDFTTFYGKAKVNFSSPQTSGNGTLYIKMQKDSIIWISVTGPLNIEVARMLVTPDSVKLINKLKGYAQISSIAHLQELTKLPLNFYDLQNIILGRPVTEDDSSSVNYRFNNDSVILTATGALLTYIHSFNKNDLLLGQSNFETVNNSAVIGANIFYNDYHTINNMNFAETRDIAVTGTSPANMHIGFKEYNFNQPQSFVFTISKNYTIKYE